MANLFAVSDPDPGALDRIEERLAASEEFEIVWRPAPGWLAAQAPLPESERDEDALRARGLAFVEGRDRLDGGRGLEWLERVADLADHAPHRLGELPGDFGFIRFRPDGTALAVRSCGGLVPLYLHRMTGGGLALGTLLNYFPRLLPVGFLPDPLINASWVRTPLIFIDGRTFVAGVSILPRASHTELSPGRAPRTGTYWDPRPDAEPQPSPEHPRELRRLLLATLSRDLDAKGRNLLMLSGGVDSSSLAALASGTLDRRLSSWSLIPESDPPRARELSYIEPTVSRFGIAPAHERELSEENDLRWISSPPGLPFQILHPALCDLTHVLAEQEVCVLMSGMFADEVCGEWQRMNDWVLHTSLRSLLSGRPVPFGRGDYLIWAKRRLREAVGRPRIPAMDLPGWAPPEVAAEYREWRRRHQAALARDHRPVRELAARADADAWVAMYWEGASPLGVRPLLPFFNREVLELAFQCHPRELLGPGYKRLLREALRNDVPARNLFRPDGGTWTGHFTDGTWITDGALPAAARTIVRSDWHPVPPRELPWHDGKLLAYAARVAEYLAAEASADAPPESGRGRDDRPIAGRLA
jgi:asparagine synthetase B (glutamine-hydrolysing)